jgi:ketosteroid isomerase-like protein
LGHTARRMSRENVEIVRRGLEAFNEREWDVAMGDIHEHAVWVPSSGFPDAAPRFGRSAIQKFWVELSTTLPGFQATAEEVLDAGGDQVVAIVRTHGIGRGSGADVGRDIGQVFTLREGKVVSIVSYNRPEHALAVAGLSD